MRGLLVAFFAVILATSPLDYLGPYRAYWAKVFLLKPNHALGLVMLPLLLGLFAKLTGRRALLAGLGLGLLGWVFIIHWVFLCFSLVVYLVLARISALQSRRELGLTILAVAVSAVIVAPWFYRIAVTHPHAVTLSSGSPVEVPERSGFSGDPIEVPKRSDWGDFTPTGASLFFLVTLDQGLLFYLGALGFSAWLRQRQKLSLLWAAMVLGAYLLWFINYLLYQTARAREADEFYYFLIFALSVAAGYGAYTALLAIGKMLRSAGPVATRWADHHVALFFLVLMPLAFPYWWIPPVMDAHFRVAMEPLPRDLEELGEWFRDETDGRDIAVADGELAHWIPAISGRQVLVPHGPTQEAVRAILIDGVELEEPLSKVRYVVSTPDLAATLKLPRRFLEGDPRFQKVFEKGHVRIYRLIDTTN
jgi:hypothetical protein